MKTKILLAAFAGLLAIGTVFAATGSDTNATPAASACSCTDCANCCGATCDCK